METPRTRSGQAAPYVPALGFGWLTPLYDPLIRLTLREEAFKRRLVDQVQARSGDVVLDLGCGTGTLTLMLKESCRAASVFGVDGDPEVLAIAQGKVAAAGVEIEFRESLAFDLPFPDGTFDRVVSSLVFHHLTTKDKERAFNEVYRVLRPGGECHIADWGKPQNALMGLASIGIQLLDGAETTRANFEGLLPELMRTAGFVEVRETHHGMTLFGTLALYRAIRPQERVQPEY